MYKNLIPLLFLVLVAGTSKKKPTSIPEKAQDVAPLLISEKVPETNVVSISGESISFRTIVKEKPSVVLFYRGGWCPFCNAHLSAVGQVEQQVLDLGYQIVGVSPDAPDQLKESQSEESLGYDLYSDSNGALMQAMGIAFQAPGRQKMKLKKYSQDKNPGILPVPSMFVVDTDGTILFEYISPDYRNRISANLLLSVLTEINQDK